MSSPSPPSSPERSQYIQTMSSPSPPSSPERSQSSNDDFMFSSETMSRYGSESEIDTDDPFWEFIDEPKHKNEEEESDDETVPEEEEETEDESMTLDDESDYDGDDDD